MADERVLPDLRHFAIRFNTHRTDNRTYELRNQGFVHECDYYVPDPADRESLCFRAAFAMILTNTNIFEYMTAVANTISLLAPSVEREVLEAIDNMGVTVNRITHTQVRTKFQEEGLELPEIHRNRANITWAFIIIAMFKNCTPENFEAYIMHRADALRKQAIIPISEEVGVPYTLERAQSIRSMLGHQRPFCAAVIRMLISNMGGARSFQNICLYLLRMIAWSDMNSFTFIYDHLIIPNSKVLTDVSLRHEVQNLAETIATIINYDMPQFFRYMAPAEQTLLLDRSRFPTLITIAQRIKFGVGTVAANNFVTHRIPDERLNGYLEIHRQGLNAALLVGDARALEWINGQPPKVTEEREAEQNAANNGDAH